MIEFTLVMLVLIVIVWRVVRDEVIMGPDFSRSCTTKTQGKGHSLAL